jgi:hypothetical protein
MLNIHLNEEVTLLLLDYIAHLSVRSSPRLFVIIAEEEGE